MHVCSSRTTSLVELDLIGSYFVLLLRALERALKAASNSSADTRSLCWSDELLLIIGQRILWTTDLLLSTSEEWRLFSLISVSAIFLLVALAGLLSLKMTVKFTLVE